MHGDARLHGSRTMDECPRRRWPDRSVCPRLHPVSRPGRSAPIWNFGTRITRQQGAGAHFRHRPRYPPAPDRFARPCSSNHELPARQGSYPAVRNRRRLGQCPATLLRTPAGCRCPLGVADRHESLRLRHAHSRPTGPVDQGESHHRRLFGHGLSGGGIHHYQGPRSARPRHRN